MGPFEFELKIDGDVFMWVPKVPAGCKVPVTHLANGTGAGAIPWFRWKLLGDKKACEAFKALPDTDQWDVVESKNEASCE
jgi:hypothetical protein